MFDPSDLTGAVVRSLVLYSLAECQAGHATTIDVYASGREFGVSDDGRGQGQWSELHAEPALSLVAALCERLTVTSVRAEDTLRLSFRDARLVEQEVLAISKMRTGNTIAGQVRAALQPGGVDVLRLDAWLSCLRSAHPALRIRFNA